MSRAPRRRFALAAVSALLVASVAILLLTLVPHEVASSRAGANSSSPSHSLEHLTGGGSGERGLDDDAAWAEDGADESSSYESGSRQRPSRRPSRKPSRKPGKRTSKKPVGGRTTSKKPGGGRTTSRKSRPIRQIYPATSYEQSQLIEMMADALGARKFVDQYLLKQGVLLDSMLQTGWGRQKRYIILVPSDKAVDNMDASTRDALENHRGRVVGFHILEEAELEYVYTYQPNQSFKSLYDRKMVFEWRLDQSKLLVFGAQVTDAIQRENLALMKIDAVLSPPEGSLFDAIDKSPKLTKFSSLIRKIGILKWEQQISAKVPLTVFAPSNAAFEQLDKEDFDFLLRDSALANRFVARHMCRSMAFPASVHWTDPDTWRKPGQPSLAMENLEGSEILLREIVHGKEYSVGAAELPREHELTTDGVLYIIDKLL